MYVLYILHDYTPPYVWCYVMYLVLVILKNKQIGEAHVLYNLAPPLQVVVYI